MPVIDRPETLELAGNLDESVARIARQPAIVDQTYKDDEVEYSLRFGDCLIDAQEAYTILGATAPDSSFDTPIGVIDDWYEPDRHNSEAKDRVKRHEKMLGQSWHDFMRSRLLFIDFVEAVPRLGHNEQEVRRITERDEMISFAAAYLLHPDSLDLTQDVLDNAGLDSNERSAIINDALSRYIVAPSYRWDSGYQPFRIAEGQEEDAAEALELKLKELPPEVTDKIIQSTVQPALELNFIGQKEWDYRTDDFKRKLIRPSTFFLERYCVKATRAEDGSLMAEPYARGQNRFKDRGIWYIPEWSDFTESPDGTRKDASMVNPPNESDWSTLSGRVVESGSLKPAPGAPKMRPVIRWHKKADGSREFVLTDEVQKTENGKIVESGIFGVILAAAMQPELTNGWPKTINKQPLGIAQVPVLALMKQDQLIKGRLIQQAEELAA